MGGTSGIGPIRYLLASFQQIISVLNWCMLLITQGKYMTFNWHSKRAHKIAGECLIVLGAICAATESLAKAQPAKPFKQYGNQNCGFWFKPQES